MKKFIYFVIFLMIATIFYCSCDNRPSSSPFFALTRDSALVVDRGEKESLRVIVFYSESNIDTVSFYGNIYYYYDHGVFYVRKFSYKRPNFLFEINAPVKVLIDKTEDN